MNPSHPPVAELPSLARTTAWADYALVDSGGGRKLERYGRVSVIRPEPQCFWAPRLGAEVWDAADAVFDPADEEDAGRWRTSRPVPETWPIAWRDVRLKARLTPFRHLGFFPEQAANWDWVDGRVRAMSRKAGHPPHILNLFGYTGAVSLAAAAAGARVTHVDASKKAVAWARENATLSGLEDKPVRWICEDARRYVQREVKRGARYDGIILDPPKYGRGPAGEVWHLFEDLPGLMANCAALLSDNADFLLVNGYAARISGLSLAHLTAGALPGRGGAVEWGELALIEEGEAERGIGLSFFARWTASDLGTP